MTPAPDEGRTLADCDPNSFQIDLIRRYLAGQTIIGVWGALGCGKSAGLALLVKVVAETRPGAGVLCVMDSYPNLRAIALRNMSQVLRPPWRYIKSERTWTHPNGSWVELRHYTVTSTGHEGQNPLEGRDVHLVIIDEAQAFDDSQVFKHANDRARQAVRDMNGNLHHAGVVVNGRPAAVDWWPHAIEAAGGVVLRPDWSVNAPNLDPGWYGRQVATRTPDEVRSLLHGDAFPVSDRPFGLWREAPWPDGNLLEGFKYDPELPAALCLDPGYRWPGAAVIQCQDRVHPVTGATVSLPVIMACICPDDCSTPELMVEAREHVWARPYRSLAPRPLMWIDDVVMDPAGKGVTAHTGMDDLELIGYPPPGAADPIPLLGNGLGLWPIAESDHHKQNVKVGIERVRRAILTSDGMRRLVAPADAWARWRAAPPTERNWARTVLGYRWPAKGRTMKAGAGQPQHLADAVRYWVRWALWDIPAVLTLGGMGTANEDEAPPWAAGVLGMR